MGTWILGPGSITERLVGEVAPCEALSVLVRSPPGAGWDGGIVQCYAMCSGSPALFARGLVRGDMPLRTGVPPCDAVRVTIQADTAPAVSASVIVTPGSARGLAAYRQGPARRALFYAAIVANVDLVAAAGLGCPSRQIIVGGAGNLDLITADGSTVVLTCLAGETIDVEAVQITLAGTTATGLAVLF